MLFDQATLLGIAEPDHYVFPYHTRGWFRKNQRPPDPTGPMTKYARQWNEIRKEAGLEGFWFYDGRHTAFTQMQESGLPNGTIRGRSQSDIPISVGRSSTAPRRRWSRNSSGRCWLSRRRIPTAPRSIKNNPCQAGRSCFPKRNFGRVLRISTSTISALHAKWAA